jgi:hypothetical protein
MVAFLTLPILAFSVTMVVAAASMDSDSVSTAADQRSVDVGQPFVWIHQDQSGSDPPLPAHLGFASPWENPTRGSATAILLNVLVVFAVTAVALAGVCILRTGRRAVRRPWAESDAQARCWHRELPVPRDK